METKRGDLLSFSGISFSDAALALPQSGQLRSQDEAGDAAHVLRLLCRGDGGGAGGVDAAFSGGGIPAGAGGVAHGIFAAAGVSLGIAAWEFDENLTKNRNEGFVFVSER